MAIFVSKVHLLYSVIFLCCAASTQAQRSTSTNDDRPVSRIPDSWRINITALAAGSEKFPLFSTLAEDLNYIRTLAGTSFLGYNGDGIDATKARLNYPTDLAVDRLGNIYIADARNNRIRKLTVSTGIITTIAGTG